MIYSNYMILGSIVWMTTVIGVIQAQDQFDHLEEFCFQQAPSEEELTEKLSFLLLKGEHVLPSSSSNCLHVLTTPERSPIFQLYLRKHFVLTTSSTSSGNSNPHRCHLKVIKKKTDHDEKKDIHLNPLKREVHLEQQNKEQEGDSLVQLQVQSGRSASFNVGDQQLKVTCTKTAAGLFALEISIINKNEISLTTSIQVKDSELFPLSSLLNHKEDQGRELSIGRGAQWQSSNSSQQNNIFLKVSDR